MNWTLIFLIAAVALFVFTAFGVFPSAKVDKLALGLACFAAAFLVPLL